MVKWITLLVIIAAIAGGWAWLRSSRQIVEVTSPVDRVYVFQKRLRQKAPLGFYQGTMPTPITGRGRTEADKLHLKMGTHSFIRPVSVARCSAGQYAISFWSHDDVSWKPPKGSATQGPISVLTADQIPATMGLRVSYSIIDAPEQLLNIGLPEAFAERAIADVLVAARTAVGRRMSLDYASVGREELSEELFADIDLRLGKRGLRLRDLWLGYVAFDPDVLQAIKARYNAETYAAIPPITARGQALANRVLAESVDPRLVELIRAERSGNPWNYWVAHMAEVENGTKALQR